MLFTLLNKFFINFQDLIPMKRLGKPEEVAEFVVTICKSGYTTGQTISVNGGMYYT